MVTPDSIPSLFPEKAPVAQKMDGLCQDLFLVHDERVCVRKDQKVRHAFNSGPFYRYFSVVFTGYDIGQPRIEKTVLVTGDYAQGEIYRAQLRRNAFRAGDQLAPGRSIVPVVEDVILQVVGSFASLPGWEG